MTTKINVLDIISGHWNTLKDSSTGKVSKKDIFTFYGLPLALASLFLYNNFSLTDNLTTLLINFSAIFTALLLSVLVLIYDQGEKIDQKDTNAVQVLKKALLEQLYFNICYSMVVSLALIFSCLAETLSRGKQVYIPINNTVVTIDFSCIILTPIVVFLTLNLMLTILMVVKRMHTLLTTR